MSVTQWTADTKRRFLDQLSTSCNVSASLAAVGMTSASLYRLRARSAAFRTEWDRALEEGYARLEAMMLARALDGEKRTVRKGRRTVIETVPCSERLALTLLGLHRRRVSAIRDGTVSGAGADSAEAASAMMRARQDLHARLERLSRALGNAPGEKPDRSAGEAPDPKEGL